MRTVCQEKKKKTSQYPSQAEQMVVGAVVDLQMPRRSKRDCHEDACWSIWGLSI